MKKLDLEFLLKMENETHFLSSKEIQTLVQNVMSVLRANRGTGRLSDHEVFVGNRFILAMSFMFSDDPEVPLDITDYDLAIIMEENEFMRMGNCRN